MTIQMSTKLAALGVALVMNGMMIGAVIYLTLQADGSGPFC